METNGQTIQRFREPVRRMTKLDDIQPNATVQGILPDALVTVVNVQRFGSEALDLTYRDAAGKLGSELLYRHDEPRIEIVEKGRPWSFDGDGALFRLVSEAQRIRLAHLFDPLLAVHTSSVIPCRTRSRRSTRPCCRGSRSASCSRTTPAPARPSWPASSSRS